MEFATATKLSRHQHETAEGYLVCRDVAIARTGTQVYWENEVEPLQGDAGGRVHVARHEDDVFCPDSVRTFEGKPLVDNHPWEPVGPDNWGDLAIGYVANVRRGTGVHDDLLLADLVFTTRRGIDAVKRGKRAISVGYNAEYEQSAPGLGRQRKIFCNHVALVDEGRCGSRCSILDGRSVYNYDAEFVEGDHPRDDDGKFATGSGGGGKSIPKTQSFSKSSPPGHGEELNGVKFDHWVSPKSNSAWEAHATANNAVFTEPPLPKTSKAQGAGVIIREKDGRVWIVHPTKQFGGYNATFPKGTVEPGMSHQATAMKEAFEESGLRVRLTGYAGDVERTTSTARYYHAERVGGTPAGHGWESEKVTLAHPDDLKKHLNHHIDQKMVDDFIATAEKSKPQPASKPAASTAPVDISKWNKKSGALGSNPGGQYTDENGVLHYVKLQKSDSHARNEHLAARLYEAAGAPVLDTKLVDIGGGKLGTATEWKDKKNIDLSKGEHRKQAQEHFAAHAWLANWDAIGLGQHENDWNQALIDGKMTTVDPGGSMIYRAQGGLKGAAFGESVGEWDSMHHGTNPMANKAFGEMGHNQMRKSALNVAAVPDAKIRQLVELHGPGTATERDLLADKLIARKRDVVHRALSGGVTKDADDWFAVDADWYREMAA